MTKTFIVIQKQCDTVRYSVNNKVILTNNMTEWPLKWNTL